MRGGMVFDKGSMCREQKLEFFCSANYYCIKLLFVTEAISRTIGF